MDELHMDERHMDGLMTWDPMPVLHDDFANEVDGRRLSVSG